MTQTPSPVALITGASRGLGLTLAQFLAGQGYRLIITARGGEALTAAAEALKQTGSEVVALPGDVTDPAHRATLVNAANQFGRLDILVNNASLLGPLAELSDFSLNAIEQVFAVNVFAPLALAQAALPLLKANGGLVINVSSDAAVGGYPEWGGYGSSKAALDLLSRTLANELGDTGVAVVAVDPGDMQTEMGREAFGDEDNAERPLPEETLPFWAWLLGQERRAVSGGRYQAQAEQWEANHETV
jgi:NAD(P)-dependent dehydrogenase (short-subunit alcohol dehydrogenase family)